MADRVTNADIEDVLSSIRRLVSIDDRSGDEADEPKSDAKDTSVFIVGQKETTEPPIDRSEDRLILSPSLRVESTDDSSGDARSTPGLPASDMPDADVELDAADNSAKHEGSQALGLSEWQVDANDPSVPGPQKTAGQDDSVSDEGASPEDPDDEYDWARRMGKITLSGPETDRQTDDPASQTGDRPQTKTLEGAATGTNDLEARIAEVEAAVAARDDQWEPDGSEPEAGAPPPITSLPWLRPKERGEDDVSPSPEDATEKDDAASVQPAADVQTPRLLPPPKPNTQPDDETPWYGDETVLDEAALRDLVSEIVRQELQGSLGERITRSVRKLVRREIHRAMMGQDFD